MICSACLKKKVVGFWRFFMIKVKRDLDLNILKMESS